MDRIAFVNALQMEPEDRNSVSIPNEQDSTSKGSIQALVAYNGENFFTVTPKRKELEEPRVESVKKKIKFQDAPAQIKIFEKDTPPSELRLKTRSPRVVPITQPIQISDSGSECDDSSSSSEDCSDQAFESYLKSVAIIRVSEKTNTSKRKGLLKPPHIPSPTPSPIPTIQLNIPNVVSIKDHPVNDSCTSTPEEEVDADFDSLAQDFFDVEDDFVESRSAKIFTEMQKEITKSETEARKRKQEEAEIKKTKKQDEDKKKKELKTVPTFQTSGELDEFLSPEQKNAVLIATSPFDRRNIFITGNAGTGKTAVLTNIIRRLKANGMESGSSNTGAPLSSGKNIAVTASTGIAASYIDGTTVHRFAGIRPNDELLEHEHVYFFQASRHELVLRFKNTDVLIIDEISMFSSELLDLLDYLCKRHRGNMLEPFGGIKMILCGDFFQLPPVVKTDLKRSKPLNTQYGDHFAFKSKAWENGNFYTVNLTTQFRQQENDGFTKILNEIRVGIRNPISMQILKTSCYDTPWNITDGIKPTCLNPTKTVTESANKSELMKLQTPLVTIKAIDEYFCDPKQKAWVSKNLDEECTAPKDLMLKVGAQVILLKNIDITNKLYNGARGVVEKIGHGREACEWSDEIDIKTGMVNRVPIKFEDIHTIYVKFATGTHIVDRAAWEVKSGNGAALAVRRQYPLDLAWAFTIHKSQGMTLDRVEARINAFTEGQVYVALSRCKSIEGLRITGPWSPNAIRAHPVVIDFYNKISKNKTNFK